MMRRPPTATPLPYTTLFRSPTTSAPPGSVNVATVWLPEDDPSVAVTTKPPVALTAGSLTVAVLGAAADGAASWAMVTLTVEGLGAAWAAGVAPGEVRLPLTR